MFWEYEVEWLVLIWHWLVKEEILKDFSSLWCSNHHEDNDLLTIKDLVVMVESVFPASVYDLIIEVLGHCCEAKEVIWNV